MKILIKFEKITSVLTAFCLLISFVIGPTAANAMTNEEATKQYKQIFKDFMLPYSYGQITSAHYAGTDRVIINIQDLHCHPKVQKNISNIIDTFDKSYGVKKVYLEGAYGKVNTSWINQKSKEYDIPNVLDKMLETGRLTGAEYYSAISGRNDIINGLEEKEPYLENLKRFGDIIENQEKINLILNAMDESLDKLRQQYYTKRQYKLEELSKEYKEGTISPQKYYALLSKHIDRLGIDLTKYENTFTYIMLLEMQKSLDYSKITNELQNLVFLLKENLAQSAYQMLVDNTDNFSKMDKLYGYVIKISRQLGLDLTTNFPNLDKYFGYIEFSQKINPLELISEEELLTQEINTRFSETKAQREVVFLINFGRYLKDYVSSKITSSDYEYYKENIGTYRELWNKYVDNRVLSLLDEYLAEADKFYKINTDRNIYFTRNMFGEDEKLNKIETEVEAKGDVNKIIENMKGVKEVDVVITGGFHSQTVTEILKNHGVSYIVITPNVTEGTKLAEDTYYQIAREQSKISFQTLANLIASLSPAAQQAIFDALNAEKGKKNIVELTQEERTAALREIIAAKLADSEDTGKVIDEVLKEINNYSTVGLDETFFSKVKPEVFRETWSKSVDEFRKVVRTLPLDITEQSLNLIGDTLEQQISFFTPKQSQTEEEVEAEKKLVTNKVREMVNTIADKLGVGFLGRELMGSFFAGIIEFKDLFFRSTEAMIRLHYTEEEKKNKDASKDIRVKPIRIMKGIFYVTSLLMITLSFTTPLSIGWALAISILSGIIPHQAYDFYKDSKIAKALKNEDYDKVRQVQESKLNINEGRIDGITIPELKGKPVDRKKAYEEMINNIAENENRQWMNIKSRLLVADENIQREFNEVAENMLDTMVKMEIISEQERKSFSVTLYYSDDINAYAAGKNVFISSELLFEFKKFLEDNGTKLSKDHIAAVLAHELQHTVQMHNYFLSSFTNVSESTVREYNADLNALKKLSKAGYNPMAMKDLMDFLVFEDEKDKEGKSAIERFLHTIYSMIDPHPSSKKRLAKINQLLFSPNVIVENFDKQMQTCEQVSKLQHYDQNVADTLQERNKIPVSTDREKLSDYLEKLPEDISSLSETQKREIFDYLMNNRYLTSGEQVYYTREKNLDDKFYEKLISLLPFINLSSQDWININIVERKLSLEERSSQFERILSEYIDNDTQTNDYLNFVINNFDKFTRETKIELMDSVASIKDPEKADIIAKFLLDESYNKDIIGYKDIHISDAVFDSIFLNQNLDLSQKVSVFNISSPLDLTKTIYSVTNKYNIPIENLLDAFIEGGCLIGFYDVLTDDDISRGKPFNGFVIEYFENLTIEDLKKIIDKLNIYSQAYGTRGVYKAFVNTFMTAYTLKLFNGKQTVSYKMISDEFYFDGRKPKIKTEDFYNDYVDIDKVEEIVKIFSDNSFKVPDVIQRLIYENFKDSDNLYRFNQALVGYKIPFKATAFPTEERAKNVPIEHLSRVFNVSFGDLQLHTGQNSLVSNANRYVEYKTWNPQEGFYDVRSLDEFNERLQQILSHFSSKEEDENPLKQNEIEKLFITFINNTFNFKTEINSFDFDISGEKFTYSWAQLSEVLLTDNSIVPTAQQAMDLLQIFNSVREYLQEEKLYAKLIYTMMNRNKNLSAFNSLEENIKLLNFLFDGPFPAKDDYLREAFDKFPAGYSDNERISNLLMDSIYGQSSKDNSNIVGGEKFLDKYLELIARDGEKYGIFLWLLTGKRKYQPYTLYQGTIEKEYVKNRHSEDRRKVYNDFDYSSLTDMFKTLTKSERELIIRKLLTDVFETDTVYFPELSVEKSGKVTGSHTSDVNVIDHLANVLFDDLNDGSMLTNTVIGVLKDVFIMVMNLFNTERKILFLNALIEGASDIAKQKYDNENEQKARMVGKFIAIMAANIGVIMVKIMQILSNMKVFDDLGEYGKYINEEISAVKSRNEPLSKNVVFQELEKTGYDDDIIVGKKLGSASVAQAFIVNFPRENKKAVVKVKRPTISKNFQDDALIMQVLFSYFKDSTSIKLEAIVQQLFSKFNRTRYAEYRQNKKAEKLKSILNKESPLNQDQKKLLPNLDKLIKIIKDELNFETEHKNAIILEENIRKRPSANDLEYTTKIAGVFGPYNSNMYFMEQAKGKDLDKLEKSDISKEEKSAIYYSVLKEFFKEAFEEGFYHADLHQGNVFVDRENKNIMLIDFGACGKIKNDTMKKSLKDIFIMAYLGDYDMFVSALSDYNPNISKDIDAARLKEILTGKTSIEQKLVDLYELFNRQDSMDEDLLMFFQGLSKIGKYLDNLSNRDMLLLVLDDVFIYDLLENKKLKDKLIGMLNTINIPDTYRKIIDSIIENLTSENSGVDIKKLIDTIRPFLLKQDKSIFTKGIKDLINILNLPMAIKLLIKPFISKIDIDPITQWLNSFGTVDEQKEEETKQEEKKKEVIKEKVDISQMNNRYNKDELIDLIASGQIRISYKNEGVSVDFYDHYRHDRSALDKVREVLNEFIADLKTKSADEQAKIFEQLFKGKIQVKKISIKQERGGYEINISAVINGKDCQISVSLDSLSIEINGIDNNDRESLAITARDAFKTMIKETGDKYYTFFEEDRYFSSVFCNVDFSDREYYNIDNFFSELDQLRLDGKTEEIKKIISYLFNDELDIQNVSIDIKTGENGYLTKGIIKIDAEVPDSIKKYTLSLYFDENGELGLKSDSPIGGIFGLNDNIFCDALSRIQIKLSQQEFAEVALHYISKHGQDKYALRNFIEKLNTDLPFRKKVLKALNDDEDDDYYGDSVGKYQEYFESILLHETASKRFDSRIFTGPLKFYVSPLLNLIDIIEQIFDRGNDDKGLVFIKMGQIKDYDYSAIKAAGMDVGWYNIEKEYNKDLKGGKIIGIIKGKIIRVIQDGGDLTFYSRQGLRDIDESEIENLFIEAIANGFKETKIKPGRVVAFTRASDTKVADMINRLNNAKTNSIMTSINLRYDLREKEGNNDTKYIRVSKSVCDGIRNSTGRNVFMISKEQAEQDAKEIERLKEEYTFIVVSETEQDLINDLNNNAEKHDRDFILDMTATTMNQAKLEELLERLRVAKLNSKIGVSATILVKFNSDTAKEFKKFNCYEKYGIIPIVPAQDVSYVKGKKEVYDVSDEQQMETLKNQGIAGFIIDRKMLDARRGKRYGIRDFLANLSLVDKDTPERRFKKGANAAMTSSVDYKAVNLGEIIKNKNNFLSADLQNAESEVKKINQTVLSWFNSDAQKYIQDLLQRGQYSEVLGFMRGVVMRTVAEEIITTLDLKKEDFFQDIKENNVQAILIITIQKMMNEEIIDKDTIKKMYSQEMEGSDTVSAADLLDQIRFRLNKDMDDVLRKNEYKIEKVDADKIADFNGIPEILMDSYGKKATVTAQVQISAMAVRSILAAA